MINAPAAGLLILFAASALAAAEPSGSSQDCSTAAVAAAQSTQALQALGYDCAGQDASRRAIEKLNQVPAPRPPRIQWQDAVAPQDTKRVVTEVDFYFNPLEAYLRALGVERMNRLIAVLGASYRMESMEITGSQSPDELAAGTPSLALNRSEWVRRYLLAAGVPGQTPVTLDTRPPREPNTALGRAKDRAVRVRIVSLRASSARPPEDIARSTLLAPLLVGTWTADDRGCTETYRFNDDGTFASTSASERLEGTYSTQVLAVEESTAFKVTRSVSHSNSEADCSGARRDLTGSQATRYLFFDPPAAKVLVCSSASGADCFGPLVRSE